MRRHSTTGFTLVELLVVIAIIAVLMSLLLPSLSRAKDRAALVSCSSNQRSIYIAIRMYADENTQYLPNADNIDWIREFYNWSYPANINIKLSAQIDPRSKIWYDPAWPLEQTYNEFRTVVGTPTNLAAGLVPYTPANIGGSYYYIAFDCSTFGYGWGAANIRFDVPQNPGKAKILQCMNSQQMVTDVLGPHMRNKQWQMLWLSGETSMAYSCWAGDPEPLVNYAGDWR